MLSANLSPLGPNAPAGSQQPSCSSSSTRRHRQSAAPLRPDLHTPTTSADLLQSATIRNQDSAADLFYSPDAPMTGLATSSSHDHRSSASFGNQSMSFQQQQHAPPIATAIHRTLTPVDRFGSPLPSRGASNAATDSDETPIPPPAIVAHGHGYAAAAAPSVAHTLMAHHHQHQHQHSPRRSAGAARAPPTMRRSNSGSGSGSGRSQRTKDTRVKLTNDALTAMAAITDVLIGSSAVGSEELRKDGNNETELTTNSQGVAMAVEAGNRDHVDAARMVMMMVDESSAGRMWDQSGASAYETDYGRDFD